MTTPIVTGILILFQVLCWKMAKEVLTCVQLVFSTTQDLVLTRVYTPWYVPKQCERI